MTIRQLTVYSTNKKGALAETTEALASANIDMKSICVADTEDFGVFRIIANDTDKALDLLKKQGFSVCSIDVVAVQLANVPGELNHVLQMLNKEDINIEYMYSIINKNGDIAYMAFRVTDNAATETILKNNGFKILSEEDL